MKNKAPRTRFAEAPVRRASPWSSRLWPASLSRRRGERGSPLAAGAVDKRSKIIVIVGPTASGKSALAVKLARQFGGEVISADSRQVYTRLDIGTEKITKKEMRSVPHHLLDVVVPQKEFTAGDFQRRAKRAIQEVLEHKKNPIIVGGTGFWIDALVQGFVLPEVSPNPVLRRKLAKKNPSELLRILKKIDPKRARTVEQKNPRRLIRAIEIAKALGHVPPLRRTSPYRALWIGIRIGKEDLAKKINQRLKKRLRQGMIREVVTLQKRGVGWKRLDELGLQYRYIARFLQKKLAKADLFQKLEHAIVDYARRQMVWFKRNKQIHWVKSSKEASALAKKFLS